VTAASHGSPAKPLELSAQTNPRHSQPTKIISEANTLNAHHYHLKIFQNTWAPNIRIQAQPSNKMNDPNLNTALKWAIENSDASGTAESERKTQLSQEAVMALFNAGNRKSDADYMRENMAVVKDPEMKMDDRVQAFDNFEQLIENLDNANNMEALGLWIPLVEQLDDANADIRLYAAWCCSTAVQNNIRTQERVSLSTWFAKTSLTACSSSL
jgi:hypothetical protein